MTRRGFVLMEVLVATTLLSLAGSGLYSGLTQAVKIQRMIRETDSLHDPFKILWMRAGKDLRNMISIRNYRFIGKQDEMAFPISSGYSQLSIVRYFTEDGKLLRSEKKLPEALVKAPPAENIFLENVETVRFEYAYLDAEDRLLFKPIWMEEPYFGLPKAVRITAKPKNSQKVFSRLFSIPQGRWGHE